MAPINAPAPSNPSLVIRKIGSAITIFSVPFARGNVIPFGGRSTAVVLKNGSTWLIPSHPLDAETLTVLKELPPVKFLVAPDLEHTLYLKQYAAAFPEAKLYLPSTVAKKYADEGATELQRLAFTFGDGGGDPFVESTGGEIKSADFGKAFVNEDIAFLHVPTKTLIEADLLFNLPPTEQYSKSTLRSSVPIFTSGMIPGAKFHQRFLWYLAGKDRVGMTASAKVVASWDFDRIIPCHGDVIETGGKSAWNSTYDWFLNGSN
ncbi:hypothetical protein RQP46_001917 [Phenoliferia psychrophenolica]